MAALDRLLGAPALMAFDFDGTLAPICADPDDVRIRPSWSAHLQRINQHWPLAVISGRRLADLTPRLGFELAFVAGNHGAESVATEATTTATSLDTARRVLASRFESIHALGIEVEDKGLSLAVHYHSIWSRGGHSCLRHPVAGDLAGGPCRVARQSRFQHHNPRQARQGRGAGSRHAVLRR
jgi:trehalose-phosphatase